MTRLAVVDTETDRLLDEEGVARIIELAVVQTTINDDVPLARAVKSWQFAPGPGGVTARASAVHHLTNDVLPQHATFGVADWRRALDGAEYAVAHNVAFDRNAIESVTDASAPVPYWICTLKCARVAWPAAPAYGNQVLRYWLGLTGPTPPDLYPHRAAYDAIVTSWLLRRLLEYFENDLERMVKITNAPSLLSKIGFGKHRGLPWREAPSDYLRWVLRQDFDEDVRYTARYWLDGPRGGAS
jgi:exodeoxyribonuclease X